MNLYEFEGKALLKSNGLPVPESCMIYSADEAAPMPFPFVLKAQVLVGGRGKAGGIRICRDQAEYDTLVKELFALKIKGHAVRALLCEQLAKPEKELYASISLLNSSKPVLMLCQNGGMDIEDVARTNPQSILRVEIDPFTSIKGYQLGTIAKQISDVDKGELSAFLRSLTDLFFRLKAQLVEINPVGLVNGKLVALDAKVILDDDARATRSIAETIEAQRARLYHYKPAEKEQTTITFVPLDGDIGLISDGAGTGMLTLDLIRDNGGSIASFCELGGVTNEDVMYRAMELTMKGNPELKAVLVVLIGGFNRMDDMAKGISRYMDEHKISIPVYTRMCGTKEAEGIAIMKKHGLQTSNDLNDTVSSLVNAAYGKGA